MVQLHCSIGCSHLFDTFAPYCSLMNFFKAFLSSCLGAFIAILVFVFLCFMLIGIATQPEKVVIAEGSVLHLKLEAPMTELELEDPLAEILPGAADQSLGLLQIRQSILHAAKDPAIKGIYFNTRYLQTGMSSLQEIRDALVEFKKSGKWVVAYADFYTEGAYFLASVADKIYLNPEGEVEMNGMATDVLFFKKLFDKLEIRPEIFRVGDFKSAVEPFMREDLSEENKLQLNELLKGIYGHLLHQVAESRNIPEEKINEIANKMLVRTPSDAVTSGLVDTLYYEDEVKADLRQRLGLETNAQLPLVKYSRYKKSVTPSMSSKNEIAVIVADGEILMGKSDQGSVGAATITELVAKARTNKNVKAIVIRINSPGGIFQAADQMWREISLAAKEKPVIASMSDYAASGGYYMAMACDTIVAQPATITGSIGVFAVLWDLSRFMDNKLGITAEEVKTGEIGELFTVSRSLTPTEMDILQKQTERIYESFTAKAAAGRHMTQDEIKKIASGRVWTGAQAKGNGLADVLGGFEDAIKIAAEKAGVADSYKIRYYPKPKPLLERLFDEGESSVEARILQQRLGEYYPWYTQLERLKHYQGVQARMGVEFKIR